MIRLMLADDHTMLREGLRAQFGRHPDIEVVAEAGDPDELFVRLAETAPDVLILDLHYPDSNSLPLLPRIREACPKCRVVILSMYDHPRYVSQAIKQGASGYVIKGAPFKQLLEAVHTGTRQKPYLCSAVNPQLEGRKAAEGGDLSDLSAREFEVLVLQGRGMAMKEIAARLHVSQKTVDTYRARVQSKLKLKNKAEVIRYALENGLVK